MVARLLLALLASVAATVFLVVGLVGYPMTDDQRFLQWVFGPPMVSVHAWTQVVVGAALAIVSAAFWYRIIRRNRA
jgi:hypothetical protein